MPRTRRPYPSDLTDQEWNLLQLLLASPRGEGAHQNGLHAASPMRCSTYCAPAAPGACCRESIHHGRRFTTTFANGASTAGCGKPTSGCEQRCASREDVTQIQAGRRSTAKRASVAGLEVLNAATMERSVYPVGNATCSWTPTGWCSAHKSMPQVCTTETVGKGFSTTSWPRSCLGQGSCGRTWPTRVGSGVGWAWSAAGGWRYLALQIGSFGATAWRRSHAASRCCRGGGWWKGHSRGSGAGTEAGQGLRAIAGERSGHDLLGHKPHNAPQARQRGRLKCLKKGQDSSFEAFAEQFLEEEFSEVPLQNSVLGSSALQARFPGR